MSDFFQVDAPEVKQEDFGEDLNIKLKWLRDLHKGDYFGEISLLTNLRRTTSIFSSKDMNLTCGKIHTDDFMNLLTENPELKNHLKSHIDKYSDKNFKFLWLMLKN